MINIITMIHFDRFPSDIIWEIVRFLKPNDAQRFSKTCRRFYNLITESVYLEKALLCYSQRRESYGSTNIDIWHGLAGCVMHGMHISIQKSDDALNASRYVYRYGIREGPMESVTCSLYADSFHYDKIIESGYLDHGRASAIVEHIRESYKSDERLSRIPLDVEVVDGDYIITEVPWPWISHNRDYQYMIYNRGNLLHTVRTFNPLERITAENKHSLKWNGKLVFTVEILSDGYKRSYYRQGRLERILVTRQNRLVLMESYHRNGRLKKQLSSQNSEDPRHLTYQVWYRQLVNGEPALKIKGQYAKHWGRGSIMRVGTWYHYDLHGKVIPHRTKKYT